jgi:hypothetical protein
MSSTANANRLRHDERKQLRRMRIISVCWLVLCFVFLFLYDHCGRSGYMLGLALLSAYVLGGLNSDTKPLRERAKQEAELRRRMRPEYIEAKREHEYSMSSGGPVKYPSEFPSFEEWLRTRNGKNRTLRPLPRIIRLKENAPELDYSSFHGKTGTGRPTAL